jgi:hypothetical protein
MCGTRLASPLSEWSLSGRKPCPTLESMLMMAASMDIIVSLLEGIIMDFLF